MIGATTLLVFNYVVVRFVFSHPRVERYIEGDADILMRNGAPIEERLRAEVRANGSLTMSLYAELARLEAKR